MIKLKDGWQIEADGMQYILSQEVTITKGENIGKTYMGNKSFHTSLKSAISSLMNKYQMAIIDEGELTLNEALHRLKKLNDEFKTMLDKIDGLEKL